MRVTMLKERGVIVSDSGTKRIAMTGRSGTAERQRVRASAAPRMGGDGVSCRAARGPWLDLVTES
jgi:hypothetical protein